MRLIHHETFKRIWNEHSDVSWKIFRIMNILYGVIALGVMIFFLYGQFGVKHQVVNYERPYTLNTEFTYYDSYGNSGEVVLPVRTDSPRGAAVTYKTILPDNIRDGMFLCFFGGRDFTVQIDGTQRFKFTKDEMEFPGRVVKSIYFFIPVDSADCGKELTIVKNENGRLNGTHNAIMYGTYDMLNSYIYMTYKTPYILALFLFLGSSMVCVLGWVLMRRGSVNLSVRLFAEGAMMLSLWALCDSPAYQFAMNNIFIDGITEFLLLPLLIFPFIDFFNNIQERRYEKIYNALIIIQLIATVPFYTFHFTDILSFEDMLRPMNTYVGIEIFVVLLLIVRDILKGYAKSYRIVVIGIMVLAVCGLTEIAFINVNMPPYGLSVIIGLYVAMGCALVNSFREYTQMEQEKSMALRASLVKTHFLANMSHELRTPINSIVGMNSMILREATDPNIREYAECVEKSSRILLGLISDVLDFSKIEAGKTTTKDEVYDTANMLGAIIDILEERAATENLRPIVNVSKWIPARLCGDEQHITQILLNLVSNATKYTNEGSVTFSAEFYPGIENKGEFVFKVEDTGIGILPENIDKIFDSFSRFDENKNKYIQGTGLGLAITKELVTALKGEINVSSEYGVGSTFTVTIPQKVADITPIGNKWKSKLIDAPVESNQTKEFSAYDVRMLVVDDNAANLMIVKQFLKNTGILIDTAEDGADAVNKAKNQLYDLILLDHMMPIMDGLEANSHIKGDEDSLNKSTPVIILTANAIAGSREEYMECGFVDYLSKPVLYDAFMETVVRHLPAEKLFLGNGEAAEEGTEASELPDSMTQSEISESSDEKVENLTAAAEENEETADICIDYDKLNRVYGDEVFTQEIVEKVAQDTLLAMDRLHESYAVKDYEKYRIDAHGIKGMMASIYVTPLQEWAKKHEFAVREDNLGFIDDDLDSFDKAIRRFCNDILGE